MPGPAPGPVDERFWSKVLIGESCWEWTAARTTAGYGSITIDRKRVYAHRTAYEMLVGPIPAGMHVCHHCDNPPCVRPSHLFLGTHTDNMRDRDAKGRVDHAVGEAHGHARLTNVQTQEIRERYVAGGCTYASLAATYGVSKGAVQAIIARRTWRHVE